MMKAAQTRRFIEMLRDSNEPNVTAKAMINALLTYVDDLREDDPADDERGVAARLERLEANLELVLADLDS